MQYVRCNLFNSPQVNLVDKEEIFHPFRMIKHPAPVLIVTDKKLIITFEPCPHPCVRGYILVQHRYMCGYACMKAADNLVKNRLLLAGGFCLVGFTDIETVLFVDEFPDGPAVVVGEGLYVGVEVKILALVVLLVLDMPDPVHGAVTSISFSLPQILTLQTLIDLVSLDPVGGNVLLITSAHCTAFGLADLIPDPQFALPVQVDSDHSKILGLDEGIQQVVSFTIYLIQGRFFHIGIKVYKCGQNNQQQHVELKHFGGE